MDDIGSDTRWFGEEKIGSDKTNRPPANMVNRIGYGF